jgi:hypothetical protein
MGRTETDWREKAVGWWRRESGNAFRGLLRAIGIYALLFAAAACVAVAAAMVEAHAANQKAAYEARLQEAKMSLLALPDGSPDDLAAVRGVGSAAEALLDPAAFARERDKVVDLLRMPSRSQAESARLELGMDVDPSGYPPAPPLVRDEIRLDASCLRMGRRRAAGDRAALAALERRFCERLLAAERRFFFATKTSYEEDSRHVSRSLPDGMGGGFLSNGRLVCVGFSMVTHSFLTRAGIRHRTLDFPKHSAIAADFPDGTSFLIDPNNDRLVDLRDSPVISGYKTIHLSLLDDRTARPLDAEKGVRAHELNNLGTMCGDNDRAQAYLLAQASKLAGDGRGSTHTANRIKLAEAAVLRRMRATLEKSPAAQFFGADWEAMAAGHGSPARAPAKVAQGPILVPVRLLPVRSRDLLVPDELPA